MLVVAKVVHTLVWALFVAAIAGLYLFASRGQHGWALAMGAAVAVEVLVLLASRMRCPLTPLAARYTDDRRPNFDIYLPQWLARYNKELFGVLYVAGLLYALAAWWASASP